MSHRFKELVLLVSAQAISVAVVCVVPGATFYMIQAIEVFLGLEDAEASLVTSSELTQKFFGKVVLFGLVCGGIGAVGTVVYELVRLLVDQIRK